MNQRAMYVYHTLTGPPVIAFAIGVTIAGFGTAWALKHGINLTAAVHRKLTGTHFNPLAHFSFMPVRPAPPDMCEKAAYHYVRPAPPC